MTFRSGGTSSGPFSSWNLADHVGDFEIAVRQNRALLVQRLELPGAPFWLRQLHGTELLPAGERQGSGGRSSPPKADGSFTSKRGVVCAVLTADCLPVLMTDGETVAALHAGWRGLLSGILSRALLQIPWRRRPLVFLGPAISVEAFEVGEELYRAFLARSPLFAKGFSRREGRLFADLYRLAAIELLAHGIRELFGGQWCTYQQRAHFFSYRREGRCGRMATLIWRV